MAQGYQRLSLRKASELDNSFVVEIACGKRKLKSVLDSGSTANIIDAGTAKRLGLVTRPDLAIKALTARGELSMEPATIPEVQFGRLTVQDFNVHVADLSASRPVGEPASDKPDGILGHDFLTYTSAVIDYDQPALYLISPVDKEWPKLKGEWVGTTGTRDGKPLAGVDNWRFHFGDKGKGRIGHATEATDVALAADVHFFGAGRVLSLTRPKPDPSAKLPFEQSVIWMQYIIQGDRLKVAFLLKPKDTAVLADRVPLKCESQPGSGVVVLEFTRKPAGKKK